MLMLTTTMLNADGGDDGEIHAEVRTTGEGRPLLPLVIFGRGLPGRCFVGLLGPLGRGR